MTKTNPITKDINTLTAENMKDQLWETFRLLRDDKIAAPQACAIAKQAKEILRVVKIQMAIAKETERKIPQRLITFSEAE